ncbi:MAG: DNA alkylation repair protein [Flavobacteriales bacterium]
MEPLKNMYTTAYIASIAHHVQSSYPAFPSEKFLKAFQSAEWKNAELKPRVTFIARQLRAHLPNDYSVALKHLLAIHQQFTPGFAPIFFPEFVALYGLDELDLSLQALSEFTQTSSSEFAIRPFLEKHQDHTLRVMKKWSKDKNVHIRRLASEGCRPRLPWGSALKEFKKNPHHTLPILENLKNDTELYVRKSVANHLNDISKDHPQLALQIAEEWKGKNERTDWIVKHALRGLLKKGDTQALAIFGLKKSTASIDQLSFSKKSLRIGERLEFSFQCSLPKSESIRIEYAIHYIKSNGQASPKVFMLRERLFEKGTHELTKTHSFEERTTRKHYPGEHRIVILINGQSAASGTVILKA